MDGAFCRVGDTIGCIYKGYAVVARDRYWQIVEGKVTKVSRHKDRIRVYTGDILPLDDEDIQTNTELMRRGIILTSEFFVMDDELRAKVERFVRWLNERPENEKKADLFAEQEDEAD